MPTQQKKDKVKELKQKLTDAKSVVFAEYTGLDAARMSQLRGEIREQGAEISIAKNSLMKIALQEAQIEDHLEGQIMTLLSYEDAVTPIKKLVEFAKQNEVPKIKIGLFSGEVTNLAQLIKLSELPSREQLLGQLVGTLNAPLTGIVNVLGGNQRKLVYALAAIADKKRA
jgi:large subunit ribosomal protein L10